MAQERGVAVRLASGPIQRRAVLPGGHSGETWPVDGDMQPEGERDGGSGIVGVRLIDANHVWGEHAIEFLCMGTAVRALDVGAEPPAPQLVLPLL